MPKGSIAFWHGSLWHGGGANRTDHWRPAITMHYCAGWVRPLENAQLSIPPEIARTFPPRLQQLLGYNIYHTLIGHVNKQEPVLLLNGKDRIRYHWTPDE